VKYSGLAGTVVTMCDSVDVLSAFGSTKLMRQHFGRRWQGAAVSGEAHRRNQGHALPERVEHFQLARSGDDAAKPEIDLRGHHVLPC
jgi:hypothetical protein